MLTPSSWSMLTHDSEMTIRRARPEDAVRVRELAQLDSASPPAGEVLLAEVGGRPVAAVSLETGQTVADPFRRTGTIAGILHGLAHPAR